MQASGRRNERVDYRVPVALTGDGLGDSVVGRSRNVSEGGLLVEAPLQLPEGEALRCELPLDGRRTKLDGHVVWSSEAKGTGRIGIRFDQVSDRDGGALRHVVERARDGYEPMQLRFGDSAETITARARVTRRGLKLSAALPILDRGTHVGFSHADGRGPFSGHVGDVSLREQDGLLRLEIDVQVSVEERARMRKHTVHGYALSSPDAPEPAAPPPRRPRQLTTPVWGPGGRRERHEARPLQAPLEPATRRVAVLSPVSVAIALAGIAAGFALAALVWGPAPREPAPRAETTAAHAGASPAAAPAEAPRPPTTPAAVAPPGEVAAEATAAEPARQAAELSIATRGRAVELTLPFAGSLEGMESNVWAKPPALIVELPGGQSELAPGNYPVGRGGLQRLQLRESERGLWLRVFSARPLGEHTVELSGSRLRLTVATR